MLRRPLIVLMAWIAPALAWAQATTNIGENANTQEIGWADGPDLRRTADGTMTLRNEGNDAASGTLTTGSIILDNSAGISGVGTSLTALNDDNVSFDDANGDYTATALGPALEELASTNASGPNASDGKVHWTQLVGMPVGAGSDQTYYPEDYGTVDPTGAVESSTAINAAIDAAEAAGGGIVKIGVGEFLIAATLDKPPTVAIVGSGRNATVLVSRDAEPLIQRIGADETQWAPISDLTLNGDSTGTIGIYFETQHQITIERVQICKFTAQCVRFDGSLTAVFDRCLIGTSDDATTTPTGVLAALDTSVQPNFIIFRGCGFHYNSSWAVNISSGAQLVFDSCSFEINGTAANDSTGVIQALTMCPNGEGVGVILNDCWFERNRGFAMLRLGAPTGACRSIVRGTLCNFNTSGALKHTIYVDGSGADNRVLTSGCNFGDNTVSNVTLTGSAATWERDRTITDGTLDTSSGVVSETVGTTDAQTLTSKRLTPRVNSQASASSLTPNANTYDVQIFTALAADCTINADGGTPTSAQRLTVRIKGDATPRTLTWNAQYRNTGAAMPTTTTASKWHTVEFLWNAADSKWDCVAAVVEP